MGLISSSSGRSSWVSDTHESRRVGRSQTARRHRSVRVRGPLRGDLNDDLSRFVQLIRRSKTPDDIVLGSFNIDLDEAYPWEILFSNQGLQCIAGNYRSLPHPSCPRLLGGPVHDIYVNEYLSGPQPALDECREVGLPNTKES